MVQKMIISAEEIRRAIGREANEVRTTGRRIRRPEGPCKEAHRGCKGRTGGGLPRTAHGWCSGCYGRWYRFGDPFGHAPNTNYCRSKDCLVHAVNEVSMGDRVSTHLDSPEGQQFHIRYTPKNGDKGPYWTHVFRDRAQAENELKRYLVNGYDDAKLFVRDTTPWRED